MDEDVMVFAIDANGIMTATSEEHIQKMFEVHGEAYMAHYNVFFAALVPPEA